MTTPTESEDLAKLVADLTARVTTLEKAQPDDRLTLGLLSGELDKTMAAFIIALGARAFDIEVDIFATFWGLTAFRDPKKRIKKGTLDTMFDMMLPRGSEHLPLSYLQMIGLGPKMIRKVMSDRGAKSLEDLIKDAAEQDVKIHLCTMTLDVMGLSEKEMIDYPHLDFVGVGQFVDLMSRSRYSWFF